MSDCLTKVSRKWCKESMCRIASQRYIGQQMWLATRTRPDISAVLGICASMKVKTPKAAAAHLVDLWRFVWTTRHFVMSTLSPDSEKGLSVDCLSDLRGSSHGSRMTSRIRQDGQSRPYTDASFATGQGRSRSCILICLDVPGTGECSVLQWSSRRQTITAYSAPEAEIVAMSEGVMTSLLTYDAAEFLGVSAGVSPQLNTRSVTCCFEWLSRKGVEPCTMCVCVDP